MAFLKEAYWFVVVVIVIVESNTDEKPVLKQGIGAQRAGEVLTGEPGCGSHSILPGAPSLPAPALGDLQAQPGRAEAWSWISESHQPQGNLPFLLNGWQRRGRCWDQAQGAKWEQESASQRSLLS